MIAEGFILLIIGMSVVFAFLTIMVLVMRIMSSVILKYFPEKEEPAPVRMPAAAPAAASEDIEIAVAIAAAYTH